MNAAAVLSRLKKAGVSVAAEDGQIKLEGPKSALSDEVLNELRQIKSELLKLLSQPEPAVIAKWRSAVEQVEPAAAEWQRVKDASLDFLASHGAVVAIENGWNAISLFGVHKGAAPKARIDCWGLILFVALGVHSCTIETTVETSNPLSAEEGKMPSEASETVKARKN